MFEELTQEIHEATGATGKKLQAAVYVCYLSLVQTMVEMKIEGWDEAQGYDMSKLYEANNHFATKLHNYEHTGDFDTAPNLPNPIRVAAGLS